MGGCASRPKESNGPEPLPSEEAAPVTNVETEAVAQENKEEEKTDGGDAPLVDLSGPHEEVQADEKVATEPEEKAEAAKEAKEETKAEEENKTEEPIVTV